jgi:hypothetical protein
MLPFPAHAVQTKMLPNRTRMVQERPSIHDGVKWLAHARSRVLAPLIKVLGSSALPVAAPWPRDDNWGRLAYHLAEIFDLFYAMQMRQKFEN